MGVLTLTACGGSQAAPAQPASSAPAAKPASSTPAASAGSNAKWDDLLAAAKKEGKVVIMGPTIQPLQDAYSQQFPKDTGVQLEYEAVPTGETGVRAPREVSSGHPTFDIIESGAFPMDALEPNGELQPVKPLLVLPEVTDPAAWRGDKGITWMDPPGKDIPRPTSSASPLLFINTNMLQPGTIKSPKDLLDPKWKGKIVAMDPRQVGSGQAAATYLDDVMGPKFITDFYKGQNVTLVKSDRDAAEGVARGTYAIAIGVSTSSAEAFLKEKLPIAPDTPAEAPGYVTGGYSPLAYVKGAAHANAAAVFLNWALSKAGQTAYSKATLEVSLRKDVSTDGIPSFRVPKEGVNYLDTYGSEYYVTKRLPHTKEVVSLLTQ